jgi:integrase
MLKKFHQDLKRLGMRPRRQHDLRRTFVSLCLGDGASKDILRSITHAPEGDVVDDYTTLVWNPLCRKVAKLQDRRRFGSGSRDRSIRNLDGLNRNTWRGGRDLNPRPPA